MRDGGRWKGRRSRSRNTVRSKKYDCVVMEYCVRHTL